MQNQLIATGLFLGALSAGFAAPAAAQNLSTERVVNGLVRPIWVGSPAGDERIFVIEQRGAIRIIDAGGNLLPTPFLDIDSLIAGGTTNGDERGLLGLAFHPDFEFNGKFFVYYFNNSSQTVLRQYTLSSANIADPASALTIATLTQQFDNHNGGALAFGPDGYLYVGTGDGGSANDPSCRAQNKLDLHGKVLRYDVDNVIQTGAGVGQAAIPPGNPFVGDSAYLPEIYHLGLRNPWRFSFDRASGAFYIGDVGQNAREEVDATLANTRGLNFGWRVAEGTKNNGLGTCPVGTPAFGSVDYTAPIWEITHSFGFSITGGYVYRGCAIPSIAGNYIVADYGSADFWMFRWNGSAPVVFNNVTQNISSDLAPGGGLNLQTPTSFGEDGRGEILICDYNGGEIFRIIPQPPTFPAACSPLIGRFTRLSILDGGTTYLDLDAGAANAGNVFFVAGTVSGTSPGTLLAGGSTLPLNIDAYTLFILSNPGVPPLTGNFGALDVNGRANARFSIPTGVLDSSYIGQTIHHAYVVIDTGGNVTLASNAVATRLDP